MSARTSRKPIREKLYVQVMENDRTPTFVDVSSSTGRIVSFNKPVAAAALQVTADAVLLSCLKLSARTRPSFTAKPLALPVGPLAKLGRWLDNVTPLEPGTVLLGLDGAVIPFRMDSNDVGIATVETVDGVDDTVLELPSKALTAHVAMPGPRGRPLAVGWTGYLNKPGTPETVTRITAQILNHVAGLPTFQTLTGITSVRVPAAPGRFVLAAPKKTGEQVRVDVPVQMWPHGGGDRVGAGIVTVTVDLDDANATTNSLLLHLEPDAGIAAVFGDYRGVLEHLAAQEIIGQYGADEVEGLVCDIVLGELAIGQIDRLKEACARLAIGVQLSPRQGLLNADAAKAS